ncbi:MAG TPA: hypothetical protein VJ371_15850 [Streptosporangiaceae bacterium]|nr:hypothetical protein [Streptosporangiaceae bacterium]
MRARVGKRAILAAAGGVSIAALAVLGRRRGRGGSLRVERGMTALRLAARGGARHRQWWPGHRHLPASSVQQDEDLRR